MTTASGLKKRLYSKGNWVKKQNGRKVIVSIWLRINVRKYKELSNKKPNLVNKL